MKKKRLFGITLALVMVLQLVLPMPWVLALEMPDWTGIVKIASYTLQILDADDNPITPVSDGGDGFIYTGLPSNAKIRLRYDFTLPDDNGKDESDPEHEYYDYRANDIFTVDLPVFADTNEAIATYSNLPNEILPVDEDNPSSEDFGYLNIADNKATVRFAPHVDGASNLTGWFELDGTLSASAIPAPGTSVSFVVNGVTYRIDGEDLPEPEEDVEIEKTGAWYDDDTGEIEWTVIVTPVGDDPLSVENVKIVDTILGGNHTYVTGSFKVGTTGINDSELEIVSNTLTYVFPTPLTGPQTITYRTEPTSDAFDVTDGQVSFDNTAAVYIGETHRGSATDNLTLNWIEKGGEEGEEPRTIDWTVTVNKRDSGDENHTVENASIKDTLPAGLDLDLNSVYILLPGSDTKVKVLKSTGSDDLAGKYTYEPGPGNTNILTYYFGGDGSLTGPATLTYTTSVDGDDYYDTNTPYTFTNKAEFHFTSNYGTPSDSTGVGVGTHVIKKTSIDGQSANYDHTSNKISWKIVVNENLITIINPVVEDMLPLGLALDTDSVRILLPGQTTAMPVTEVYDPVAGHFSYNPATRKFVYTFPGTLAVCAELTFETTIEDPDLIKLGVLLGNGDANGNVSIYNTAVLKSGNLTTEPESEGSKTYKSQMIAKKVSGYDFNTRYITWEITVNRNKIPLHNVTVTDEIPAGLDVVSVARKPDADSPETPVMRNLTTEDVHGEYTYTPGNEENTTSGELVYFMTDLSDQLILIITTRVRESYLTVPVDRTFINSATLKSNEMPGGLTATASKTVKNPILEKTAPGYGGEDFVTWAVPINANQIPLRNIVLTDTLESYLTLDETSVKLYTVDVASDGKLVNRQLVTEGFDCSYDKDTKEIIFTLPTGEQASTQAYELVFITDIDSNKNEAIRNTISFNADSVTAGATSDELEFKFNAIGGGSGIKGSITIEKLGAPDAEGNRLPLNGVEFTLYDKNGNAISSDITDDGKVTFSDIALRLYYVEETHVPNNYLRDPTRYMVRLNKDNPNPTEKFENELALGEFTFLKQSAGNNPRPLAGARFALYNKSQQGGELEPLPFDTAISGTDGLVTFTGIPLGDYELVETRAPSGYRIPKDAVPVQVTVQYKNGTDQTAVEVLGLEPGNNPYYIFVNERVPDLGERYGTILIKKTDGEGKALAGAEFTLYDDSGKAVETAVSGSDGRVVFSDLPFGRYTVKETGVPEGYEGSDTVISVNVQRDTTPYEYTVENLLLEELEDPDVPGDGEDPDDGDDGEDLDDPNAPGGGAKPDPDKSPKTGSPSFYPLWLLFLGSLTGIATVLRYPKKRRGEN